VETWARRSSVSPVTLVRAIVPCYSSRSAYRL